MFAHLGGTLKYMAMVAIDIFDNWSRLEECVNWSGPLFGELFWHHQFLLAAETQAQL